MRVLVVEDDIQLNLALATFFKNSGYEVVAIEDGEEAVALSVHERFDLYVIDINIPNIDGLELLRYIRRYDITTAVIIITASLEIQSLTTAYQSGCDEYLKKPFHLQELKARVEYLCANKQSRQLVLAPQLSYDQKTQTLFYNDAKVELRHKERRFLQLLLYHQNSVVAHERIYEYVWEGKQMQSYPLRQLVKDLRVKLPYDIIKTRIKEGYIIETYE
ncbi:MAG: response regulator transcription factor [Campylobacterota bacterium]